MPHALNPRSFVGAAASFPGVAALAPLPSAHGGGGQRHTGTNTKAGLKAALPDHVPRTPVTPDIASVSGSDGGPTPGNSYWWSSHFKVGEPAGTQLADLTPYPSGIPAPPAGSRHRRRVLPAGHPGAEGHHGRAPRSGRADGKSTPRTFMGVSTSIYSYLDARLKPQQTEELPALPHRRAHRRCQGLNPYRAEGTSPDRERSRSPLPAA
ncbi:hypothetical protein ACWDBD_31070 [Streptomyces sp. NPDC001118]